jgi:hypothetical protein
MALLAKIERKSKEVKGKIFSQTHDKLWQESVEGVREKTLIMKTAVEILDLAKLCLRC